MRLKKNANIFARDIFHVIEKKIYIWVQISSKYGSMGPIDDKSVLV